MSSNFGSPVSKDPASKTPASKNAVPVTGPGGPSMLDLIRLSPNDVRPPGGRSIYRQIALLADLTAASNAGASASSVEGRGSADPTEVLSAPSGAGLQLAYLVREFGVHGSGVDPDPRLVARADARARGLELEERLHFQDAPLDALPYRDEIFDLAIGELGLTSDAEPADAVQELVRVTKPGGTVVLLQLVWKAPVEETRRRTLIQHLGTRPLMLVEWKRLLMDAGVGELHTAEWSDEETPLKPSMSKPFPEFSERFTLRERFAILRKAWRLWGWRGVRDTLAREAEVHRLLTRERILGFVLLKGTKGGAAAEEGRSEVAPVSAAPLAEGDLPLFRAPGTADPSPPRPASPSDRPIATAGAEAEASPEPAPTIPPTRRSEGSKAEEVKDLPLFETDEAGP